MTIDEAIFQDILHNPDDDAPRLVYADWLEESGTDPARADFIRVQLELDALTNRARNGPARASEHDPRVRPLRRREESLWQAHSARWRLPLPEGVTGVSWSEGFTRGFQESVRAERPASFVASRDALMKAAPIRSLKLEEGGEDAPLAMHALLSDPGTAQLRELDVSAIRAPRFVIISLESAPVLDQLQTLLLHRNDLGDLGVALLGRVTFLPRLAELYLSGCEIDDDGAYDLAFFSPHFPRLVLLDLRDNRLTGEGLANLARSPHYPALTDLWLVNNRMDAAAASHLAGSPLLGRLKCLWLGHNPLGDEAARSLAGAPQAVNLEELDLRHCAITDAGALALARSPYLSGLLELALSGNVISRPVAQELRDRFGQRVRL